MKNTSNYLFLLMMVCYACTEKDNPPGEAGVYDNTCISAEVRSGQRPSRVTITDSRNILWQERDSFMVMTGSGEQAIYHLQGEGNVASGMFRTDARIDSELRYAVYPARGLSFAADYISLDLPQKYSNSLSTQIIPMYGALEDREGGGSCVSFRPVMGVLRMDMAKIGEKTGDEYTAVIAETSNIICGKCSIGLKDKNRVLKADNAEKENKCVRVETDKSSRYCYIPLPEGRYGYINIYVETIRGSRLVLEARDKKVISGVMYDAANIQNTQIAEAWEKYKNNTVDNVLLDFSYAGYEHGEMAPEEISFPNGTATGCKASNGYTIYNVREAMNVSEGMTARQALEEILVKCNLTNGKKNPNARAVIYFPEGEYVLHNDDDNTYDAAKGRKVVDNKGNNVSHSIMINGGHFVIKGAGRKKTVLRMDTPNLPGDIDRMYSSPTLFNIKHTSGLSELTMVTSDAEKGEFSLRVANPEKVNVGDWVCLYLNNNDRQLIADELYPHAMESFMTDISTGIKVNDYHQVAAKKGDVITFAEPIMHEVRKEWEWKIMKFNHFRNVGVEDLSFRGKCVDDFKHHRSWIDDGAYKPITMLRLVNSWLRRVDFYNVSEACTVSGSANVSVYDAEIKGNRGHSAIRSAGSSRVFIGAVNDRTGGPGVVDRIYDPTAGQYHACGVSKPSMGAVIWNVHWGTDGCFESHASQPRATLIDNCWGGFLQSRQGGATDQVPNHLNDLTIWNMNVEKTGPLSNKGVPPSDGKFDWWRYSTPGHPANNWKILPPVLVGVHGLPIDFTDDPKQIKYEESTGKKVFPESLYEAQLQLRLGYVPAWLQALKGVL